MAKDRVEAVERALTIMDVFDNRSCSFSLSDLAEATGFYKSTLLRLLGSLERFDYVQRGSDGHWQLGMRPVQLARRHSPSRQLAGLVQPALDSLVQQSGETAALLIQHGKEIHCRLSSLPASPLRHELQPGERWISQDSTPRPELPGGFMHYVKLDAGTGDTHLWLSLSGPAARLSSKDAHRMLEGAKSRLNSDSQLERISKCL